MVNQNVLVISFNTDISFDNLNTEDLDDTSKELVIITCANVMNISKFYVKYLQSDIRTKIQVNLFKSIKLLGFNVIVKLHTSIPLQGHYNKYAMDPYKLYNTLTNKLINSVNSGNFITQLQILSANLNTSTFSNATVLTISNDDYQVIVPKQEKNKKQAESESALESIISVIGLTLLLFMLSYTAYRIQTNSLKCPFTAKRPGLIEDQNITINPLSNRL